MRSSYPSRLVVALLALQLSPGIGEMTENAVHFVFEGHGAHDVADADHAPSDPEHGCSGPFHQCACHQSSVFLPVGSPTADAPVGATEGFFAGVGEMMLPGYPGSIDRPPAV